MSDSRLYKSIPRPFTVTRVRPKRVSPQNLEVPDGNTKTPTPLPPRPDSVGRPKQKL
tara:strand:+ start:298 stop:468 length:171 start_codon:yes stop_codon:yes gene_type:complete